MTEATAAKTEALVEAKRRCIVRGLREAKGDKDLAAHLVGVSKTTLYRKLKELDICIDEYMPERGAKR
jgi:transcriptional regulator with PAS, ATPase and Fis domain